MSLIRRVPLPAGALALSLATLGNLLGPLSPVARMTCGILSAVISVLLVARIALDWESVSAELGTPAALAVLPALFMALMQLATYIKPIAPAVAVSLWSIAVALQLLVSMYFIWRFVFSLKIEQVLPSWFLIFVGYVVATVTSPAFGMIVLGRPLLIAGLVGYAFSLPLVAYRLVKVGDVPVPARGTLGIFAAPPSLCLVGYLTVVDAKQPVVVYVLLTLAAASLLFVFLRLPAILRGAFSPAIAGLTFPLVISAVAFKQSAAFLTKAGTPIPALGTVASALLVLSAAVVIYVLGRYVAFLGAPRVAAPVAAVEPE